MTARCADLLGAATGVVLVAGAGGGLSMPAASSPHAQLSVTLLRSAPHTLADPDARLGQALADVTATSLSSAAAVCRAASQLREALDSRVLIEQAKGVLAARAGTGTDEAFAVLRGHARSHRQRLIDLARRVVDGTVDLTPATGRDDRDVGPRVPGARSGRRRVHGRTPEGRAPSRCGDATTETRRRRRLRGSVGRQWCGAVGDARGR